MGIKRTIKLIGNSGIQFYDGAVNLENPAVIDVGIDFAEIGFGQAKDYPGKVVRKKDKVTVTEFTIEEK